MVSGSAVDKSFVLMLVGVARGGGRRQCQRFVAMYKDQSAAEIHRKTANKWPAHQFIEEGAQRTVS
jgi:hypothetical protein